MPCTSRIGVPAASTSLMSSPRWMGDKPESVNRSATGRVFSWPTPKGYVATCAAIQATSVAVPRRPLGVSRLRAPRPATAPTYLTAFFTQLPPRVPGEVSRRPSGTLAEVCTVAGDFADAVSSDLRRVVWRAARRVRQGRVPALGATAYPLLRVLLVQRLESRR